jgi:succinoglycan biosynthesis transport protein ExoP
MEKKQEGERFQLLDAANFPLKPLRPNRLMIGLIGFLLGLGGGVGLAIVWDNWDTSFRKSDDINAYVNVPVLATIPALVTRGSVIEQRRSQSVLVFASLGALVVGAVLVRIFAPMYF